MTTDRMEQGWRELAPAATGSADQPDQPDDGGSARRFGARANAAATRRSAALPWRGRRLPRAVSALLLLTAVIMVTYAAASALVDGDGALSFTRVSKAMGDAYAAAEYRKARIACQQNSGDARDYCIAQAHAEEQRARAFAATRRGSEIAFARASEEARDLGGPHSIIVDPACNLIARGRSNLCEIQVGNPASAGLQATNLIPPSMRLNLAAVNNRSRGNAKSAAPDQAAAPMMVAARSQSQSQRPRQIQVRTQDHIFDMAWSSRQ